MSIFLYVTNTEFRYRNYKHIKKPNSKVWLSVGIPGFEPGKAGPESAVLPLHHIPILLNKHLLFVCVCKGIAFFLYAKTFCVFFHKKNQIDLVLYLYSDK